MEIRDRRLYRETHATWEAYLEERWQWSRSYAHRNIEAAKYAETLPMGNKPANEREARRMMDAQRREEAEDAADALAALEEAEREGTIGLDELREEMDIPAAPREAPAPAGNRSGAWRREGTGGSLSLRSGESISGRSRGNSV